MIAVIDNYDSFTYNLVQYLYQLGQKVRVWRNDAIDIAGLRRARPAGILISPGPGKPNDAGISLAVIEELGGEIPILGVCLGHQSIGQAYGGTVGRAKRIMHGKTSGVTHDGRGVFRGLPQPLTATRYHSLVVLDGTVPDELEVTARTDDGEIMGLRHRTEPVYGIQFHPESILTASGYQLLANWLRLAGQSVKEPLPTVAAAFNQPS